MKKPSNNTTQRNAERVSTPKHRRGGSGLGSYCSIVSGSFPSRASVKKKTRVVSVSLLHLLFVSYPPPGPNIDDNPTRFTRKSPAGAHIYTLTLTGFIPIHQLALGNERENQRICMHLNIMREKYGVFCLSLKRSRTLGLGRHEGEEDWNPPAWLHRC